MHVAFAILAAFVALTLLTGAGKRKRHADAAAERASRAQALFDRTREFVSQIEAAGSLPSLEAASLNLQAGEFAILCERGSVLRAFRTRQVAVEGRTRSSFAGISLYPEAWELAPSRNMTGLATGDLYLTNRKLVFLSLSRNLSIEWKRLLAMEALLREIVIHTNESHLPVAFTLKNPALWTMMMKWMCSADVTSPKLETGTRIMLEFDVNPNGIQGLIRATVANSDEQLPSST